MSDDPAYFLVPASSGLCIQLKNGTIYTAEPNGSAEQTWFIEKGSEGQIAFRNGRDGQYLRGVGGGKGARIVTGQKQFWSLESSSTPNAFWIKCVDFPNAYLCNSYGKWSMNNLIYMWAHELRWTQTMLWYVSDFGSWEEHKNSKPGFDPSKPGFSELSAKEKSVEDTQKKLEALEKELEKKQKLQEAKEHELEGKSEKQEAEAKELQKRQEAAESASSRKAEEREKELAEKLKEVDAKVEELAEKEEQLRQKGKSADKQDSRDVDSREPDEKQKKLEDREKLLAEKELELQQREARLKEKEESLRSQAASEWSMSKGDLGPAIPANGVQSTRKELEAASVGRRSAPLRLRTSQRNTIEKGELRPITMASNFVHLPRLRAG
ncbi:hypothetical protein AC579_5584 [Pseudocercospora musae]|uniref:Uncharacterized protein n=1 Tax=Pseudocercospora musae TaxID=113226 RepID=A0A139IPB3_9PEZI|nr:hypothetical protein AC579_5584 [Pseudocercospora musae]